MNALHALILGAVQGLTEVLPISSSAHLILIPWLAGWPPSGLTFDVALHVGTLLALLLYFWRDIFDMTVSFIRALAGERFRTFANRLPFYIIIGSIPAAIVGKTLEEPIEAMFRGSPARIAFFLIFFALVLAFADTMGAKRAQIDRINLKAVIIIGIAQCLALIPGVSRSGITITAALLLGFKRDAATRFSFLLSLPIVAGAGILKLGKLMKQGIPAGEAQPLVIGIAASAFFGYLSIALLLKLVQRHTLYPFVWYRLVAGTGVLLVTFLA